LDTIVINSLFFSYTTHITSGKKSQRIPCSISADADLLFLPLSKSLSFLEKRFVDKLCSLWQLVKNHPILFIHPQFCGIAFNSRYSMKIMLKLFIAGLRINFSVRTPRNNWG
jgi:hypothetical protein